MNQYGRRASDHWKRWLPERYSQLPDPETFFGQLGEEITERVRALSDALAGDDPPGEAYLGKLGRLNMTRLAAEGQALREMALLEPEPGVDSEELDGEDPPRIAAADEAESAESSAVSPRPSLPATAIPVGISLFGETVWTPEMTDQESAQKLAEVYAKNRPPRPVRGE
jgi:hypothetical protein